MTAVEAVFDGIVGPSHTFGGLAVGNRAAAASAGRIAHPRAACRQGIAKMRLVHEMGVPQGVLPPHERPHVSTLRAFGFTGTDHEVVVAAHRTSPDLFAAVTSASAMWVANAATVSPSAHTADGRCRLTVANLSAQLHRSIEAPTTLAALAATFPDAGRVAVSGPIPAVGPVGDEGAANHTRLGAPGTRGLELFVHGSTAVAAGGRHVAGRQDAEASRAVARSHGVESVAIHAAQSPTAIAAGVFHHDVIGVGHHNLLFIHEDALVEQTAVVAELTARLPEVSVVEVPRGLLSLDSAVASYLFNSQFVTTPDGRRFLLAPSEVGATAGAIRAVEDLLLAKGLLDELVLVDLGQSMGNGGGPACCRLRVELTADELASVRPGSLVDGELLTALEGWADSRLREELTVDELADPAVLDEIRIALDDLTGILGLGAFYDFQR